MYNGIATANFLDEVSKARQEEILEAVYECGFTWDDALTDKELFRLRELHERETVLTLSEAAIIYPLAYPTLAQAAREGRFEAEQHGKVWLTTRSAIEKAIEAGKLRPRKDSEDAPG